MIDAFASHILEALTNTKQKKQSPKGLGGYSLEHMGKIHPDPRPRYLRKGANPNKGVVQLWYARPIDRNKYKPKGVCRGSQADGSGGSRVG